MEYQISSLSVILPCFNEAGVIENTVAHSIEYLRGYPIPFEIIVVDDGSRDHTLEVLEKLCREYRELRVVRHAKNRGYGPALRTGFDAVEKDWIFLMDSDGQFDICELSAFFPFAASHDMVLGYRANRADSWQRAAFTKGYQVALRLLLGLRFRDIGCAFKLFRRETWLRAQPVRADDHKIFIAEWLERSIRSGCRIVEVPVTHYPRRYGSATGARLDVIGKTLAALVSLAWRERFGRR